MRVLSKKKNKGRIFVKFKDRSTYLKKNLKNLK